MRGFGNYLQGLPSTALPSPDSAFSQAGPTPPMSFIDLKAQLERKLSGRDESFFFFEFARDLFVGFRAARRLDFRKVIATSEDVLRNFKIARGSTLGGVRKMLRSTSNGFLAYQFGIKPLIHDTLATLTAYDRVKRKLAVQKARQGKWLPFSVSRSFEEQIDPMEIDLPTPGGPCYVQLTAHRTRYTMTAEAYFDPIATPKSRISLLASEFKIFDAVGLAWELVPYSFMIDWFVHVDKKIEAFQQRLSNDVPFHRLRKLNLHRHREYVASYFCGDSYDRNIGMVLSFGGGGSPRMGSVKRTFYDRNNFELEAVTDHGFQGLDYFQRLIALALIGQRGKN